MNAVTRARRGFTALEAMAALVLLGVAIMVASGVALRRHAVARQVDERVAALRVVSSRMDETLSGGGLAPGTRSFAPGTTVPPLPEADGTVTIDDAGRGLVRVRVELRWKGGGRIVRETLAEARP